MQCNGPGRRKTTRPIKPTNVNPTRKVRVRIRIIGYGYGWRSRNSRLAHLYTDNWTFSRCFAQTHFLTPTAYLDKLVNEAWRLNITNLW